MHQRSMPEMSADLVQAVLITIVLDLLLVPASMWLVTQLLVPDAGYATGLLLVAVAAAGPLGIKLAQVAGGAIGFAIGIVVLELANVLAMPLWSAALEVTDTAVVVISILRALVLLVLAPLGVGYLVGRWRTSVRPTWPTWLARASDVGVIIAVGFVIVRNLAVLGDALRSGTVGAAVIVITLALAAGWLLGGPERDTRVTTSLVTGVRANAAVLAIALTTFAGSPEVTVAGVISVVLPSAMAFTLALRARAAATGPIATD
jgi:BASS family bile acid:Na+ symporter